MVNNSEKNEWTVIKFPYLLLGKQADDSEKIFPWLTWKWLSAILKQASLQEYDYYYLNSKSYNYFIII